MLEGSEEGREGREALGLIGAVPVGKRSDEV